MRLRCVASGGQIRPPELTIADLDHLGYAAKMLAPLEEAAREFRTAIETRDLELLMRVERRLLGIGCLLGDRARTLEATLHTTEDPAS